ncbi:glycoside hydrolase family 5 protein [Daldinia caldariorum]|uniref:glycoside hydrolase family 5 protein n=1 Tax=Daldinia caldariorum TaxID=326644 RepID=UPI002008CA6C|nr:glycoside hydrolase family 5 protein [Daldinia caldariorum]KAI1469479.1 glycoside hydrolase family 5 protein [Daldinia caldariorum]
MYFMKSVFLLAAARVVLAKVQFLGVSIAGGEFGCKNDGSCPVNEAKLPDDGVTQMWHFVGDDAINILRMPVSWQFLVGENLGGKFDSNNFNDYDRLIQACLATGAYCMIDIHNYGRWNGKIIGQGGPTDDQFVNLWQQLATKYSGKDKVIFELMNEPHDVDVDTWAETCQKAVTAIRKTGATKQMILLPASNFDGVATLTGDNGAEQLLDITNPDGSKDNLLLDIHAYLDKDNTGTNRQCTTDNTDAFGNLAKYLRIRGRKGLVSQTGASQDSSCLEMFCAQNKFINDNSDVFVGIVGWGAGSVETSDVLSMTPTRKDGRLVDNQLMSQCLVDTWAKAKEVINPPQPEPESTTQKFVPTGTTALTRSVVTPPPLTSSSSSSEEFHEPIVTVHVLSDISILQTDISILQTASVPPELTTLITAAGSPSDESYSIAWEIPTSVKGSPTQVAPSTTPTGGAPSTRAMSIFLWSCAFLPLLL